MISKSKPIQSKKIRASAKNENCTLRIIGACNNNPETTVLAHHNGAGMGIKHHDIESCYSCSNCHDWLDGLYSCDPLLNDFTSEQKRNYRDSQFLRASMETRNKLIQKELIKIL